jgi:hypothetical protein
MHALLLVLVLAGEPSVQMDLSLGATTPQHDDDAPDAPPRDATTASLYVGGAYEARQRHWSSSSWFAGAGFDGTIDGRNGPYHWSVGFGPRIGRVWRSSRSSLFPDGYLYARATPFVGMRKIADEAYLQDDTRRLTQAGAGMRLGVGLTVPAWSATVAGAMSGGDLGNMHFSDPREAIACIAFGAAVILFNHVELTWETYHEPGLAPEARVGIRFGTGF